MEFDRLFEDLEGQMAAEWEAERAALDAETERARIAKLSLRDRLRTLTKSGERAALELPGNERWDCVLRVIGADWIGVTVPPDARLRVIPLHAVRSLGTDHGAVLASLHPAVTESTAHASIRERMTLGFVLRDLARRRAPLTLATLDCDPRHGTIDRAGADHLDLALHDPGEPRRATSVRGFALIPFAAVCWVRIEREDGAAL